MIGAVTTIGGQQEMFYHHRGRHKQYMDMKIGVTNEGKITAVEFHNILDWTVLAPNAGLEMTAGDVLSGDGTVAAVLAANDGTLSIAHPYEDGMAEEWIRSHPERLESGKGVAFAVTLALYAGQREEPVVIKATVARDDGG